MSDKATMKEAHSQEGIGFACMVERRLGDMPDRTANNFKQKISSVDVSGLQNNRRWANLVVLQG